MSPQSFKPSPQYLTRLRIVMTIIALAVLAGGVLMAFPMIFARDTRPAALIIGLVIAGLDLAWYLPALAIVGPYHRSLRYEVQDDEVIVYAGIWTQSVKHVPYRTVTNLTVKRDILDRWLGTGTLEIQTAGMSGSQSKAEECLVGLANVQAVYSIVAAELRRFRGAMGPAAAEAMPVAASGDDGLQGIAAEVRAIRRLLEQQWR
ncbi:MAG TPA: PH domain-containing protein [Anaerolineae bacterium]|nr:PH domain-containing protein [Anaerolineae bacterium]HOQ99287.1 PH domain-containing protein [Anaerolineae bacterium]HPL26921.1 PH domain-containing protein [Anaerolineae bacterium]